jgi:DNA-binding IclR family transcriptional regulator
MSIHREGEENSIYRIQVLDRAFQILGRVADEDAGVTLPEIARRLQLHKSTAHRLLMALEAARFIEKNPATARYRLGSRVIELGLSAVSRLDVYQIAGPHLRRLAEQTGETGHLAVLRDGEVVSVLNVESRQTVRTPSAVGARSPVHCTAHGKAALAFSPPDQLAAFLRNRSLKAYTPNTLTTATKLRAELEKIRQRGYSIDDEEWESGLRCIGAPVRDSSASVIAAVSISGPVFRIRNDRVPPLGAIVVETATRISSALGYRATPESRAAPAPRLFGDATDRSRAISYGAGRRRPRSAPRGSS